MKLQIKSFPSTLVAIAAFSSATIASAQSEKIKGDGNMSKQTVSTADYDAVNAAGFFDINLIAGKEGQIVIEGEQNIIVHIECKVENGTLKIATEKGYFLKPSFGKSVIITVPFESLNEVRFAGSGDLKTKNTIKASDFTAVLAGSGDVTLDVDAKEVTSKVAGSGNMILKGKANQLNCNVAGSGDLDAFALESNNVDSSVTGSGNCKVTCSDLLQAKVAGSGNIDYKGDPKKKETKVVGSGSISKV